MTTTHQLAARVARLEGAVSNPIAGKTTLSALLCEQLQRIAKLEHEAAEDRVRTRNRIDDLQKTVFATADKVKLGQETPAVRVMPRDELIAYVKLHYTKHTRLYILQQLLGDLT